MAQKIIHLEFYRNKELKDLVDPCSQCEDEGNCSGTCELAGAWWDKLTDELHKQQVKNLLGGD